MKKRELVYFTFIFSILFFSCSNNHNTLITYVDEETLKINIKEMGENTIWTKELEGEILTENIKKNNLVLNNTLSPTVMSILSEQYESVYPYFENFGNLDLRNLHTDLKVFLDKFCLALSEDIYNVNNSYISKNFYFSYLFFVDDLSKDWKKFFRTDFPIVKPTKESLEKAKNTGNEENNEIEQVEAKNKLFTKWVLGQPFNADDYVQIPVRLYAEKGSIDVILCLTNKTPYEVFNIEITNWEVEYGK